MMMPVWLAQSLTLLRDLATMIESDVVVFPAIVWYRLPRLKHKREVEAVEKRKEASQL